VGAALRMRKQKASGTSKREFQPARSAIRSGTNVKGAKVWPKRPGTRRVTKRETETVPRSGSGGCLSRTQRQVREKKQTKKGDRGCLPILRQAESGEKKKMHRFRGKPNKKKLSGEKMRLMGQPLRPRRAPQKKLLTRLKETSGVTAGTEERLWKEGAKEHETKIEEGLEIIA